MKYTVLDLTQSILSSMDGEEVNSISDTTEARQVAQIIRTTYYNILSRANLPEHQQLFTLTSSADADLPVLMTRPDNVRRVDFIKYNVSEDTEDTYSYVTILPTQQFLDQTHMLREDDTTVDILTLNNQTFYFRNDKRPEFCTALRDYYFIFDSYNSEVEATLQSSKTLCQGLVTPAFTLADTFTPELDDAQFPLLLAEATSAAFLQMKQIANDQSVRDSRRGWSNLQKSKHLVKPNDFDALPYFGRK